VAILAVLVYGFVRLRHSKIGRAFEAIKEDETAAKVMGINITSYKLLAFVLGAIIAGVAGGLNAHFTFFVSPREYGFDPAVDILTAAIFGGTGSFVGPMVGGSILAILPELLRFLKAFRLAVNGLILILVVIYLPNGIWDRKLFARLRRKGSV
jgi:branched-chain amino acid transport system permease protein